MVELTRRGFTIGASVAALGTSLPAFAQSYPSQDIYLICAFPPGSGADIIVRYFAERLRPITGRTIVVENKPGASGNIATQHIARAKPDGYTIMIHGGTALSANMHLFKVPAVDVEKEIRIAATLQRQPTMIVVDSSKPWKSVAELTAAMKEKGEKGSYGVGNTIGKVMGATYKTLAGLKAEEIPYKATAQTLNDLQSGALDYAFHDNAGAIAYERQGRVRILGVSTAKRMQSAPQYPTMTEQGYPMDMVGWWAAMVPMATPRPVVDQINGWIKEIITSEDGIKFLASIASDPWVTTPEEGQAYLSEQVKQWGEWVRAANIPPLG